MKRIIIPVLLLFLASCNFTKDPCLDKSAEQIALQIDSGKCESVFARGGYASCRIRGNDGYLKFDIDAGRFLWSYDATINDLDVPSAGSKKLYHAIHRAQVRVLAAKRAVICNEAK
jgi:hypothetical protein